jgi:hypothetical protein
LAALSFAVLSTGAIADDQYSGDASHARVVDADTGAPIKDAVIVATWELSDVRSREGTPAGVLLRVEAVSGSDGNFSFAHWGPIALHSASLPQAPTGLFGIRKWRPRALDFSQPELVIFAPGYAVARPSGPDRGLDHLHGFDWTGPSVRASWFDGRTLALHRNGLSAHDYAETLNAQLPGLVGCSWTALPNLTIRYLQESTRLAARVQDFEPLVTRQSLRASGCPDVPPVLRNFLERP